MKKKCYIQHALTYLDIDSGNIDCYVCLKDRDKHGVEIMELKLDTCILPNIRLLNLIFKRFTYNRSYTSDELSLWVEQSQDLMQRSTASFLIVTNSGPFLSFGHLFKLNFFLAHFYSSPVYSVHAVYLFCN